MIFLDFEKPIQELYEELDKLKEIQEKGKSDVTQTIQELENRIEEERKKLYANLTGWQKVQLSRHMPTRPYTL
jgi:acetyl-CoA carboxylase carboxyl transferase subunit alpha